MIMQSSHIVQCAVNPLQVQGIFGVSGENRNGDGVNNGVRLLLN